MCRNAIAAATPHPTSREFNCKPVASTSALVAGPSASNNRDMTKPKPIKPTPTVMADTKARPTFWPNIIPRMKITIGSMTGEPKPVRKLKTVVTISIS